VAISIAISLKIEMRTNFSLLGW